VPTLTFDGKRYLFNCEFQNRALPKAAGFHWDKVLKWFTTSEVVAARLREYATGDVKKKLSGILIEVSPWSKPLPQPPKGKKLLPHQVEAVKFALSRNRCYLGLDPGLGKTICAATIAKALGAPVVYVSPPFLMRNVEAEFKTWAPEVRLMVLPDSQLTKEDIFHTALKWAQRGAMLVVDEAHRFKTDDALRTQCLLGGKKFQPGLFELFGRQVFMSGTPMPNRPKELFSILSVAAPETIGGMEFFDYGRRYCNGFKSKWGWDFDGASNLGELVRNVIYPDGPFMIRMRKDLLDLPPKLEEVFILSKNMSPRLSQMDKSLGKKYASAEDLIKNQIAAKAGKSPDDLHIGTYRKLLGLEKVEPVSTYVDSILDETEESILLFAYHREVIAKLAERLKNHKPLVITGATPSKSRQAIVNQFQEQHSGRRLLIGNYQAVGIGFTLTKATRGIFAEYSWVPGENEQAGDRMHRIGQKNSVLIQYMLFEKTLDQLVLETLMKKRRITQYV
jgi:SWI/SNF-related matrix-associated actin-dependent regulator 1 of chromatin subfamily A